MLYVNGYIGYYFEHRKILFHISYAFFDLCWIHRNYAIFAAKKGSINSGQITLDLDPQKMKPDSINENLTELKKSIFLVTELFDELDLPKKEEEDFKKVYAEYKKFIKEFDSFDEINKQYHLKIKTINVSYPEALNFYKSDTL